MAAQWTSEARALKHNAIVIGWYFDKFDKVQAACLHRFDCFLWCHPQLCFRTSRFSKDRRLVARAFVPIDDCKLTVRCQCASNRLGKPNAIRNAVKGIGHENKVRRSSQLVDIVSITCNEPAIGYTAFLEAMFRNLQQAGIDVDCRYLPSDFCHLKS